MRKTLLAGAAAIAMAASPSLAEATSIGSTPASDSVLGIVEGWFAANLFFVGPANTPGTIQFIGIEAADTNDFLFNAASPFGPQTGTNGTWAAPAGPTVNVVFNPGLLNFSFTSTEGGGTSIANGANSLIAPRFFISFPPFLDITVDGSHPSGGVQAIVAFDDGGGGPDDDFDDFVVLLTVSDGTFSVPAPASLLLMGMGLLGLGFASRRRAA